jgi:ubiquinone/menaquinone biosynthesis C-methylase UbiE
MEQEQILLNIRVHNAIASRYESVHHEIFNGYEQSRLASTVQRVLRHIGTNRMPVTALDVGCGSGNVTSQLLAAGCVVTGADISDAFLSMCETKFAGSGRFFPRLLSGRGLSELPDSTYDVVTAYSVLHHVPDYLGLVAEMVRVTAPGGIILIDHEKSERVYQHDTIYKDFARLAGMSRSTLKEVLTRTTGRRRVIHFIRSVVRPGFETEGDIHVWPDDHIEFDRIRGVFHAQCEVVEDMEYLLHPHNIDASAYSAYASRCVDTRMIAARKLDQR